LLGEASMAILPYPENPKPSVQPQQLARSRA
jgi:hypothetical protein